MPSISVVNFFQEDDLPFTGFDDDDIEKTSSKLETKIRLIQSSLRLKEEEKFAAVDPKLWSLHPATTKRTAASQLTPGVTAPSASTPGPNAVRC